MMHHAKFQGPHPSSLTEVKLEGYFLDAKYRPSPIPRGGLEIFLTAVFKIADEKRRYLERLQGIISENYNVDMETHMGSRIAGDSISIFEREFGENEDEINEEELDPENDTMVIIMEDEGDESANRNKKNLEVTCIED